jgi:hypothetical protein
LLAAGAEAAALSVAFIETLLSVVSDDVDPVAFSLLEQAININVQQIVSKNFIINPKKIKTKERL